MDKIKKPKELQQRYESILLERKKLGNNKNNEISMLLLHSSLLGMLDSSVTPSSSDPFTKAVLQKLSFDSSHIKTNDQDIQELKQSSLLSNMEFHQTNGYSSLMDEANLFFDKFPEYICPSRKNKETTSSNNNLSKSMEQPDRKISIAKNNQLNELEQPKRNSMNNIVRNNATGGNQLNEFYGSSSTASWDNYNQEKKSSYTSKLYPKSYNEESKQNPFKSALELSRNDGDMEEDEAPPKPSPIKAPRNDTNISAGLKRKYRPPTKTNKKPPNTATSSNKSDEEELPEELKHLDKELVQKIYSEILSTGDTITFDDIAGLDNAKQTIQELIIWPMKRPDLFTGLRKTPNGLLLFGPPGTGKTLIGKAIAHESSATFFSISSSSLTSKWIGEGEKLVRTLFSVAIYRQPSVVFMDEIDSLLTARKSDENEASRRMKTEFLVQFDGTGSTMLQSKVLIIGATNRPEELDDAARRRFVKRIYVPLPKLNDRMILLQTLLNKNRNSLTNQEIQQLASDTDGFSGADLKALCTDAALWPIRSLKSKTDFENVKVADVAPISYKHFRLSLRSMNPSVSQDDLENYLKFDETYGSKPVVIDEEDL